MKLRQSVAAAVLLGAALPSLACGSVRSRGAADGGVTPTPQISDTPEPTPTPTRTPAVTPPATETPTPVPAYTAAQWGRDLGETWCVHLFDCCPSGFDGPLGLVFDEPSDCRALLEGLGGLLDGGAEGRRITWRPEVAQDCVAAMRPRWENMSCDALLRAVPDTGVSAEPRCEGVFEGTQIRGESCVQDPECGEGLRCNGTIEEPGTCYLAGDAGTPCNVAAGIDCGEGAFCSENATCEARRGAGESCDRDEACASSWCFEGECGPPMGRECGEAQPPR